MNRRNHYIYITAGSLACYRELANGPELVASIATPRNSSRDRDPLDQSMQQFETHLDAYPHDRYFVITDTQAEAYQAETVPTLSRRDLRLLLTRKMEQRYRTTPYRSVVPHRSRPYAFVRNLVRRGARTTTRILYALISPDTLAPWLEALERRALDVRGLYSLGALMPALRTHLKLPEKADALFVLRTASGYRHAFVSPSGLRFSRLCPYSNSGETQLGQEIDKTLQYLTMTRLWGVQGRHRMLHIAVIDAQPSSVPLTVPGNNLRPTQLTQVHPRELIPRGPAALLDDANSAWLLFNGAGFLAVTEYATREKIELAATSELIADHVNATAEASEAAAPKTELQPQQLRALVQTRDRLLARNVSALGLMQRTAMALAPFSDLNVDGLEWFYVDPAAVAATASAGTPPEGVPSAAPNSLVLRLSGHTGANLSKSDANAAVMQLAVALAKELHGRESIEKLPFDVAPGGTLTGTLKEGAAATTDFRVAVTVPAAAEHAS